MEAGLSKMTFYRNFDNKETIAYELMRTLVEKGHVQFTEIMERPESLPIRLRKVIQMKLEQSRGISDEFLSDAMRSEDPKFQQLLQESRLKSRRTLTHFLLESIERAEIDQDLSVEFVLFWMDEIGLKMEDEALTALFPDPTDRMEHLIRFFFFGISGRNNNDK